MNDEPDFEADEARYSEFEAWELWYVEPPPRERGFRRKSYPQPFLRPALSEVIRDFVEPGDNDE